METIPLGSHSAISTQMQFWFGSPVTGGLVESVGKITGGSVVGANVVVVVVAVDAVVGGTVGTVVGVMIGDPVAFRG